MSLVVRESVPCFKIASSLQPQNNKPKISLYNLPKSRYNVCLIESLCMYYVYVLLSQKDGKLYTGFTDNLRRRCKEHNTGAEPSTKHRIPFELIYWEGCLSKKDAIAREKFLKTGKGKRFIKNRLKFYLERTRL